MSLYLSHGDGPFLCEGVVVEVEDAEAWVVLHGCGQGCHTRMIDAILGHVDLLQAAHQLGTHIVIVGLLYLHSHRELQQFVHNNSQSFEWSSSQITNNMSYIDINWSEISI